MKKVLKFTVIIILLTCIFSSCTIMGRRYSRGFFLHMSVLGAQRIKQKAIGHSQKKVPFPVITKIIADLKIRNMTYAQAQTAIRLEEQAVKKFFSEKKVKEKKAEVIAEVKNILPKKQISYFTNKISKNKVQTTFLSSSAKVVSTGADPKTRNWFYVSVWVIGIGLLWELWLSKYFKD